MRAGEKGRKGGHGVIFVPHADQVTEKVGGRRGPEQERRGTR